MEPGITKFYECEQCKNIFSYASSDDFSICPVCGYQNAKIMETQLETPQIELIANDQLSSAELKIYFQIILNLYAFVHPD